MAGDLYLNKENPNERWDNYYSNYKKTKTITFIEWVNKQIFTPMFLKQLKKITKKNKNKKILEPGCGAGLMSALLAKENQVTVLDLSQKALLMAKKTFKEQKSKGEFIQGDLFNMPFKDEEFDIVWNQGVLEHFSNPSLAMKEMARVTKKGGYIVIFIPAYLSPLHFIWLFLKIFKLTKLWPFDEQEFFKKKQFKKFMIDAGFKNPKVRKIWMKSFGMSQVGYYKKK